MGTNKIKDTRLKLSSEYENLIKSLGRGRLAVEETVVETTDEIDLAVMSHDRHILYNLNEGGIARLRVIKEAITALDRGQYGECSRCGNGIDERRLDAVPWATKCIRCQEETENERDRSRKAPTNRRAEDLEL
jgi:DnaK suppressor protein